jgi:hypothetical protein
MPGHDGEGSAMRKLAPIPVELLLGLVSGFLGFLTVADHRWLDAVSGLGLGRASVALEWSATALSAAAAMAAAFGARARYQRRESEPNSARR